MAEFDPTAYLKKKAASGGDEGFNPKAYLEKKEEEDSFFNSPTFVGVETGAMLGARPIIGGAGQALGRAAGFLSSSGDLDMSPTEKLLKAWELAKEQYTEGRIEKAREQKAAYEKDPAAFMGGALAGVVLTGGAGASKALASGAGMAGVGGLDAYATSEKEGLGRLADTATGAALSYGIGKALPYVPKVVGSMGKGLAKGAAYTGEAIGSGIAKGARAIAPGVTDTIESLAKGAASGIDDFASAVGKQFEGKVSPYFKEKGSKIAQKIGMNLDDLSDEIRFGNNSTIGKNAKVLREGPLGDADMNHWMAGRQKVEDAVTGKLAKMSGGEILSPDQAGEVIKSTFDTKTKQFFDGIDFTYDNVTKAIPGLNQRGLSNPAKKELLGTIRGVRKTAIDMLQAATPGERAQGKILFEMSENLKRKALAGSFQQIRRDLRRIGNNAFGRNMEIVPQNIKAQRDLYGGISKALTDTVEERGGKAVADSLRKNNKMIHNYLEETVQLRKLFGNDVKNNHDFFRSIVERGDTNLLQKYLQFVDDPELKKKLAASFVDDVMRTGKEGNMLFGSFMSKIRNNPKVKRALTNIADEADLKEIEDLVEFGVKGWDDAILNKSNTHTASRFREFMGEAVERPFRKTQQEFLKRRAIHGNVPPEKPIEEVLKMNRKNMPSMPSNSLENGAAKPGNVLNSASRAASFGANQGVKKLLNDYTKYKNRYVDEETAKEKFLKQ